MLLHEFYVYLSKLSTLVTLFGWIFDVGIIYSIDSQHENCNLNDILLIRDKYLPSCIKSIKYCTVQQEVNLAFRVWESNFCINSCACFLSIFLFHEHFSISVQKLKAEPTFCMKFCWILITWVLYWSKDKVLSLTLKNYQWVFFNF